MFNDLEDRAFRLGRRMAVATFSIEDNPFAQLQPRLARKWLDGFVSQNSLLGKIGRLRRGARGALDGEREAATAQ
ncbi:MAG: hypothetical protein M5U08_07960 [Burkholderiales bacterium]|nr:hypothetical protein [Burkholderiales bacterium]